MPVRAHRGIQIWNPNSVPERQTKQKGKITFLELVYTPMSNQEAIWLENDPEVEERLRESDFYMIGAREEAKFQNLQIDADSNVAKFDFVIGNRFSDPVIINLNALPATKAFEGSFWIEGGDKMIRVWDGEIGAEGSRVLEWFTTEKLIRDRAHLRSGISGLDRFAEAATYTLLYVGIAKKGDSFDRLIQNGHKARQSILGNEQQRSSGARVTDEIYLFLFRPAPLIFTTFDFDHKFRDSDLDGSYDHKQIVADAEKAFVSILKPEYNVVKFANYPKGADGLYGSEYDRYGYAICEELSFDTPHGRIRGGRNPHTGFITNSADAIFVDGDQARLFIAGVDFPVTP
jgi:hypothetical protein